MKALRFAFLSLFLMMFSTSFSQKTVAVLDPTCRDNSVNQFYKQVIRGALESAITNTNDYEAYDRTALDKILEEHDFQRSGIVDDSKIRQLGMMAGVNYIMVSEVSAFQGDMSIIVKILNIETGKYEKTADELTNMTSENVRNTAIKLGNTIFNVQTKSNDQTIVEKNKDKFVGNVVNGKKQGKGTLYFANGDIFEGNWEDGVIQGQGIYYYTDGTKIIGTWKNGKRNGPATFYYENGNRMVGVYVDDKWEGPGTFYWANGDVDTSTWKNGIREGKFKRIKKDGTVLHAKFSEDKITKDWH